MARLWLRLYTDVLHSAKVQTLPPEDFRTLVNLWCVAKEHRGVLPSSEEIAWGLRIHHGDLVASMERLRDRGLLDYDEGIWSPHDWDEWQYGSDGPDAARERKRKERAKKQRSHNGVTAQKTDKNVTENQAVTTMSQPSHSDVTDTCHADVTLQSQSQSQSQSQNRGTPLPPWSEPTPIEVTAKRIIDAHPKGISERALQRKIVELTTNGKGDLHEDDLRRLEANTLAWCAEWTREPKFTPEFFGWLTGGGWLKPPPAPANSSTGIDPEDLAAFERGLARRQKEGRA